MRSLLLNRFAATLVVIAVAILGWNFYVVAHDDGRLTGRVVTIAGDPAAGVPVVLSRRTIASIEPIAETVTDSDGRFAFHRHGQYALYLTAGDNVDRHFVPLWFRNQNRDLREALVASSDQQAR